MSSDLRKSAEIRALRAEAAVRAACFELVALIVDVADQVPPGRRHAVVNECAQRVAACLVDVAPPLPVVEPVPARLPAPTPPRRRLTTAAAAPPPEASAFEALVAELSRPER